MKWNAMQQLKHVSVFQKSRAVTTDLTSAKVNVCLCCTIGGYKQIQNWVTWWKIQYKSIQQFCFQEHGQLEYKSQTYVWKLKIRR